jgi:hypothetical protein
MKTEVEMEDAKGRDESMEVVKERMNYNHDNLNS